MILDFVQFLLDRQLISAEEAKDIRHRAATERTPLGQILVMSGAMTVRQVMNVLDLQADHPGRLFGEIAVEAGYLSTVALETALSRQRIERSHQITLVRNAKLVADDELCAVVTRYVKVLELQCSSAA